MLEALIECREKNRTARQLIIADVDMSDIDLSGLRADGLQLNDVALNGACLSNIRWRACSLNDVRLSDAVCRNAVLRMCEITNLIAVGADFFGARIENTDMQGAVFDRADFTEASLVDSLLGRASFRGATLDRVDCTGVNLRGADLRAASLRNAILIDADLRGADLSDADLEGVNLKGADLRGAIMDHPPQAADAGADLPPEFKKMAVAVGPLVAELLKKGEAGGLIESQTQASMMEVLRQSGWSEPDSADSHLAGEVDAILQRVSETGITPLIDALKHEGSEPPKAVATLLETLSADLGLDKDASAEELLARLTDTFKQPEHE